MVALFHNLQTRSDITVLSYFVTRSIAIWHQLTININYVYSSRAEPLGALFRKRKKTAASVQPLLAHFAFFNRCYIYMLCDAHIVLGLALLLHVVLMYLPALIDKY